MIRLRDDVVFDDPESRIREYCEIEVYWGYEDRHSINDVVSKDDVDAANELYAMIDRYDKNESNRLLRRTDSISGSLSVIPNVPLYTLNDEEWDNLQGDIRDLFLKFLLIHGFGLAKTTKILHLKRPEVFPVLDSLVVKFLLGAQLGFDRDRDIKLGLNALDKMRNIIIDNLDEFVALKNSLSDLHIPLTITRLFDILCWSTEKWDIQGRLRAPKGIPSASLLKTKPEKQSKR